MLMTLTCTPTDNFQPSDLGYLVHKHPSKQQQFSVSHGTAHVFYPEVTPERCVLAMLLEVDPVGLVRRSGTAALDQYVNDRPYAASSFFAVAMNNVFRDVLVKKCKDRPQLVEQPIPLSVTLAVVRCGSGDTYLRGLFEPLGYTVECERHALDPAMGWNEGPYYTVTLSAVCPLHRMLNHIYILLPVLDRQKHYYVDARELEKLLLKGEGWLADHPLRDSIVERYLKRRSHLMREALARLSEEDPRDPEERMSRANDAEEQLENSRKEQGATDDIAAPVRLHDVRLDRVAEVLKESGYSRIADLGCGGGKLITRLRKYRQFQKIIAMDVSYETLMHAKDRLRWEDGDPQLQLLHGSLLYRDSRLKETQAAALVEVIEHLDPPRLRVCERNLFGFAKPNLVIITTPNRDYNVLFPTLSAGKHRHSDHRFEWTRAEFAEWCTRVATEFGYNYTIEGLGPEDETHGCPSQMAVFRR